MTKWLTSPEYVDAAGAGAVGAAAVDVGDWSGGRGMGYIQVRNDPCLLTHPLTGHQIVIWVDDLLCRGTIADCVDFYNKQA